MDEKQIETINQCICDAINDWASIMVESEASHWAYYLNYNKHDLMNAVYIFNHIAANIGIKNGCIDGENCAKFGERLRDLIIDMTGFDPHKTQDFKFKPYESKNRRNYK